MFEPTESKPATTRWRRPSLWLAMGLLVFGVVEVSALGRRMASVAPKDDWSAAAEHIRADLRPHDLVVAAPYWANPLLREALGAQLTFDMAGYSDLAPFERLWVVSIRGADFGLAPSAAPASNDRFGGVRVRRWDLGPTPVRDDLAAHLDDATVEVVRGRDVPQTCRHERGRETRGGGLGTGPMQPADRFVCPGGVWVGRTVNEDLSLLPRHCVYQPAVGRDPVRVMFPNVEFADRLVFYGGLYAEAERMEDHVPVDVVVRSGDRELGRLTHRDGEGWVRHEWATTAGRGPVTVEVSAENGDRRMFCWAATTRGPARRGVDE